MVDVLGGVAMVPLIVGLVEMAKRLGLAAAWAAPLAVGLGLAASLGWALTQGEAAEALLRAALLGIALGLSASGLYSGAKTVGG